MKKMCNENRFQEIREANGNTSKKVFKEMQDSIDDMEKASKETDKKLRAALI